MFNILIVRMLSNVLNNPTLNISKHLADASGQEFCCSNLILDLLKFKSYHYTFECTLGDNENNN